MNVILIRQCHLYNYCHLKKIHLLTLTLLILSLTSGLGLSIELNCINLVGRLPGMSLCRPPEGPVKVKHE